MVTHTQNSCSAFNPSKVHTHTAVNTHTAAIHTAQSAHTHTAKCTHTHSSEHTHTHTVNTHPAAIHTEAPGEQLGVRCLGQGHLSRGIESTVHSPPLQFLPARDSNPQPFDYESDSLTIRPQHPPNVM